MHSWIPHCITNILKTFKAFLIDSRILNKKKNLLEIIWCHTMQFYEMLSTYLPNSLVYQINNGLTILMVFNMQKTRHRQSGF